MRPYLPVPAHLRTPTSNRKRPRVGPIDLLAAGRVAENLVKQGKKIYDTMKQSSSNVKKGSTSRASKAPQTGILGGKIRRKAFKKNKSKFKGRKNFTSLGYQNLGAVTRQEVSFENKTDSFLTESVRVGHTSLPSRVATFALGRAFCKMIINKHGLQFHDFEATWTSIGSSNDESLVIYYYTGPFSNTTFSQLFAIADATKIETTARQIGEWFNTFTDINRVRLWRMTYLPNLAAGSNMKRIIVDLNNAIVSYTVKSSLKVQNRSTGETGGTEDNEVDNAPLQGYVYKCKGNNFLNKTNSTYMFGVSDLSLPSPATQVKLNDILLFDQFTKHEVATYQGGDRHNNTPGTVKISEPPKPSEILNCVRYHKIYLQPGEIRTSVLYETKKVNLMTFVRKLYADLANATDSYSYHPSRGMCQVLHLERVIGSNTKPVKVRCEVAFDMSVAIITKYSNITNPVQIQQHYGALSAPTEL